LYISAVSNGINIDKNIMSHLSTSQSAIVLTTAIADVKIIGNKISATNSAIADTASCPYLLMEKNNFQYAAGGFSAYLYAGSPNNALFRSNIWNTPGNHIHSPAGTLFLDQNDVVSGTASYGTTTVKNAQYA